MKKYILTLLAVLFTIPNIGYAQIFRISQMIPASTTPGIVVSNGIGTSTLSLLTGSNGCVVVGSSSVATKFDCVATSTLQSINYWKLGNAFLFPATSTDYVLASYFTASSTTGTSTFPNLNTSNVTAISSAGFDFHSNNGTLVATWGAGGGANASIFGGTNIYGTVSGNNFTATSTTATSSFPNASTTNLYLSGNTKSFLATDSFGRVSATSTPVLNVTGSGNIASSGGTSPNITFTGTLPVANGGTGSTSWATNFVLLGNGTNPFLQVATSSLGIITSTPTGLTFTSGTGALSLTSGYVIPLIASTTEWATAYASTTALTPAYLRGLFSNTATGLTYNSSTGATSLTAGYVIPLTASTTEWAAASASTTALTPSYIRALFSGTSPISYSNTTGAISCPTCNTSSASVTSVAMTVPTGLTVSGSPITTSGTLAVSLGAGYVIPLTASTTEWATAYASTTALTPAYMRGLFSNTAIGLTYNSATGATSLTAGYNIPLTASTTNWDNFYNTPSTRITAGTNLSWSGNTLNGMSTSSLAALNYWTLGNGFLYNATSSNMVGVGSTSPIATLSVQGSSTFPTRDLLDVASSSGTRYVTVTSGGNVGIASSSPVAPLSVVGNFYQNGSYAKFGNAEPLFNCNTGSGCLEVWGNDNTVNGVLMGVGNRNGGTSAYNGFFLNNDIANAAVTNYAGMFLNSSTYSDTTFGTAVAIPNQFVVQNTMGPTTIQSSTTTNGYINFVAGGSATANEAMRITSAGLVGIGTTSPNALLSVGGDIYSTGRIGVGVNPTASSFVKVQSQGANTASYISNWIGNTATGTNAWSELGLYNDLGTGSRAQVLFTSSAFTGSDGANTLAIYNNVAGSMVFGTNGSEKMRILSAGNVGIGTSTPGHKLVVSGNEYITSALGVGITNTTANTVDIAGTGAYKINGLNFLRASSTLRNYYIGGSTMGNATMTGVENLIFTSSSGNGLTSNTTGSFNIALNNHWNVLNANTTGSYNVAIGDNAMRDNTTGSNNVALGAAAMVANQTGSNNVAFANALGAATSSNNNFGLGYSALGSILGGNNIGIGAYALSGGTGATGYGNFAAGGRTMWGLTTGIDNIAIGTDEGINSYPTAGGITTGSYNIVLGRLAFISATSSSYNIIQGASAGGAFLSGDSNIMIGQNAGRGAVDTTSGSYNTFLGFAAGSSISSISRSTAIGYQATVGCEFCLALGGTGASGVNVGIGTTTPYAELTVKSNKTSTTTLALVPIAAQTADILDIFNNAATPALDSAITAAGNWGIGTSTPAAKLVVSGVAGTGDIFAIASSTAARLLTFTASGRLGVGSSTPISTMAVQGSSLYPTTDLFDVASSTGANVFAILSSGRVGVSTSSPTSQFAVTGTSTFDGPINNLIDAGNTPSIIASTTVGFTGGSSAATIQGRYAYLVNRTATNNFAIVDVSNPSSPILIATSSLTGAGGPLGAVASGNYVYVADRDNKQVEIVDVSSAASSTVVGTVTGIDTTPGGPVIAPIVSGRYLYISGHGTANSLYVIDVASSTAPYITGSVVVGTTTTGMVLRQKYMYMSERDQNVLSVVNVSNPSSPTVTSTTTLTASFNPSALVGSDESKYIFAFSNGTNKMEVINVANPVAPTVSLDTTIGSGAIISPVLSGRYIYAIQNSKDIIAIDVSSSTAPFLAGKYTGPAGQLIGGNIAISGRNLYVNNGYGLSVFDLNGIETQSLTAHSLEAGFANIINDLVVSGIATIHTGLNVGAQGIMTQGSLAGMGNGYIGGTFGVGTTSPVAKLSVTANPGTPTNRIFAVASSTNAVVFSVDGNAHVKAGGSAPTLSACGTSPSISGNDTHGTVTVGSVSASGCTITFAVPFTNAPDCTLTNQSMSVTNAMTYTVSTTALTVSQTGLTSAKLNYMCFGQ